MPIKTMLFAVVVAVSSVALAAPLTAAEREAKERRLVEIYQTAIAHKGPPPADVDRLMAELKALLFELAGVDPATATPEDIKKLADTQGEILNRRDPDLAAEMLRETQRYKCRSKQIDAKVGLKGLGRSQEAWKSEHGKYTAKLGDLDLGDDFGKRYDFKITKADAKHFAATATGKADQTGDVWEVDEKLEPSNTKNLCEQSQAKH